jgi:hypothetical protein
MQRYCTISSDWTEILTNSPFPDANLPEKIAVAHYMMAQLHKPGASARVNTG